MMPARAKLTTISATALVLWVTSPAMTPLSAASPVEPSARRNSRRAEAPATSERFEARKRIPAKNRPRPVSAGASAANIDLSPQRVAPGYGIIRL